MGLKGFHCLTTVTSGCLLALGGAAPAYATEDELQVWTGETLVMGLGPSTSVSAQLEQRFRPEMKNGDVHILRFTGDHAFSPHWSAGGGVQYMENRQVDEADAYQQVEWSNHGIAIREWIEERFQTGGKPIGWRWRQRVELSRPLDADHQWEGKVSGEFFFLLNQMSAREQTGLTGFRGQITLRHPINHRFNLQLAYLYNRAIRHHAEDTVSHTPFIVLTYRM
ncbi:DUF2490 domain-containing protein [Novosphingobium umbonatum]|uniref:DUF2490 domain-containing protein n=1 Tax=Novosphingobium umbonatum TaxID=1908524 RepID=A0A3S2VEP9_9SPHN|nr:DUF2490 domain-containing protein [Novosphingobium umbonatum]